MPKAASYCLGCLNLYPSVFSKAVFVLLGTSVAFLVGNLMIYPLRIFPG